MNEHNVNLIAFGTFGNPNGFTQTFCNGGPKFKNSIRTFDIRGSILIYPNSKLYSIRKEYRDGYNIIAYTIYTYAQEPSSARGGSFIGSSILFTEKIGKESITISCLNEFHTNLKSKNVQNNIIGVDHSEKFDLTKCKPKDFDKISFHLRDIDDLNFEQTSNKSLLVFCRTNDNTLQSFLKKSVDLLNVYDNIYYTDNKEVAEFVRQKGIFTTVDENGFEIEIKKLAEERARKVELLLVDFTKEKQKAIDSKIRFIEAYNVELQQISKIHIENEHKIKNYKDNLPILENYYSDFLKKIDEIIHQLKSTSKPDIARQNFNEHNRIFINNINKHERPDLLTPISKPSTRSDLKISQQQIQRRNDEYYDTTDRTKKDKQIDIFKITTLILLILFVGTLFYFLFYNDLKKYS